jgi:hypothetical protein
MIVCPETHTDMIEKTRAFFIIKYHVFVVFLTEDVANRPLRAKSCKAGDDVAQEETRLS